MIKNRIIISAILVLGLITNGFTQEKLLKQYIILAFERKFVVSGISPHGVQSYYWIIPVDSIKSYNYSIFHLFLDGFSKNNLDDCCNGKEVDPFLVFPNGPKPHDSLDYQGLNQLHIIIKKNKKLLLSVTKKWQTGNKEYINVFAIPVSGKFCSSDFHQFGQRRTGYKGKVFIPYAEFSFLPEFWKSPISKFIVNRDFSKVQFDIISY